VCSDVHVAGREIERAMRGAPAADERVQHRDQV